MFEIDSEFTLERDIKNRVSHPIEMWEFPVASHKKLLQTVFENHVKIYSKS